MPSLKKLTASLVLGMTAIGWIFIEAYFRKGDSTYALIILGIGLALLIPLGLYNRHERMKNERESEEEDQKQQSYIARIKRIGDVICINAGEITVNSKSIVAPVKSSNEKEVKDIEWTWSTIEFEFTFNGERRNISSDVPKDPYTLKMKLLRQEELHFYVNPFDPGEYYIDLEFLD